LADQPAVLSAIAAQMFAKAAAGAQPVDWDTLATAAGADRAASRAEPLRAAAASVLGGQVGLRSVLEAGDCGRLDEVLGKLPPPDGAKQPNLTGRAARELAKTSMLPMLYAWAVAELAAQGRLRWRNSWADVTGGLEMESDLADRLEAAVDAAGAVQSDFRPPPAVGHRNGVLRGRCS